MKKLFAFLILLLSMPVLHAQQGSIDERVYNATVDFSKIQYWVGSGDKEAAFVFNVNTNELTSAAYLVYGYRWSGENPTVKEMLQAITKTDTRFKDVEFSENSLVSIDYTEGSGYGIGNPLQSNNFFISDIDTPWHYTCIGTDGLQTKIKPGDTVVHTSKDEKYFIMSWLFYRPADSKTGVIIPDEIAYYHSDFSNTPVPVFINLPKEDGEQKVYDVTITALSSSKLSPYLVKSGLDFTKASEFPCNEITVCATVSYVLTKTNEDGSKVEETKTVTSENSCRMVTYAPVRPLLAINFEYNSYSFPPKSYVNQPGKGHDMILILQPEDATFTKCHAESSNSSVASYNKDITVRNGKPMFVIKPGASGSTTISITSLWDKDVACSATLWASVGDKGVTNINIDEIHVPYKGIWGDIGKYVEPADALIKELAVTEIEDDKIVRFYSGTQDLVAYASGETNVTFSSIDGTGYTKKVKVIVEEPYEYEGNFTDGFFILNEDWYGHSNASINYFPYDGEPYYRAFDQMNRDTKVTLGATGCWGFNWGGRMYLKSKQSKDPGDYNKGLALAVADAYTLKNIPTSLPSNFMIGWDENSLCLGDPRYVDVWNIAEDKADERIALQGINPSQEEVVNMVRSGRYLYVLLFHGLYIVDMEKREQADYIEYSSARGIVRTCDGTVWVAAVANSDDTHATLFGFNKDAVNHRSIALPDNYRIQMTDLWWSPQSLFASPKENVLFWKQDNNIARCDINEDGYDVRVLSDESLALYGYPRYDGVTDLIVSPSNGFFGYMARYGCVILINPETGATEGSIPLPEYYWFQEIPIFPDKYLPEISIDNIDLKANEPLTVDLSQYVTDPDPNNMDIDIVLSIANAPDENIVAATLNDRELTLVPAQEGKTELLLKAMSNGRTTERKIGISVGATSGIGFAEYSELHVSGTHGKIYVTGAPAGATVSIYNTMGMLINSYRTQDGNIAISMQPGLYIVDIDGQNSKKVIVR